jgi:hypothetical protein
MTRGPTLDRARAEGQATPPEWIHEAAVSAPPSRPPHYFSGRIRSASAVIAAGFLITGILAWTSFSQYDSNEDRLINLRVKEAGNLISTALPTVQTPLASAAALADASRGNAAEFRDFISPQVGPNQRYVSASIWAVGSATPASVVGDAAAIASHPAEAAAFFGRSTKPGVLRVTGIIKGPENRIGYAFRTPSGVSTYIAYGEGNLPANRRLKIASDSAFADLDYAFYLGSGTNPDRLLATSVSHLPISGRHATAVIPFGDSAFTLVMSARRPISGTLAQRLPLLIILVGVLLTLGAAWLSDRLVRRRQVAEHLVVRLDRVADENRQLYAEQRTVAETLQQALLPEVLPQLAGAETAVRYLPGVEGMHIGGDWYDVITLDASRMLFVVGDVSGRGVRAAAVMASLLYAVRAYAAEGDAPDIILTKLSRLSNVEQNGRFATVMCIEVDIAARRLTVANAGHLPPLLVHPDHAEFLATDVGVPVGVATSRPYTTTRVAVPPRATLLTFTDGLIERRGESIDAGLERLRTRAEAHQKGGRPAAADDGLTDYVTNVVDDLVAGGVDDDAVLLGVRWLN